MRACRRLSDGRPGAERAGGGVGGLRKRPVGARLRVLLAVRADLFELPDAAYDVCVERLVPVGEHRLGELDAPCELTQHLQGRDALATFDP